MDLDTLAKLGEFLGGVFVVVSLVHLARQVPLLPQVVGWDTAALRVVRLELRNAAGETVDDDTYWIAPHDDGDEILPIRVEGWNVKSATVRPL